jgi:RyR domain
METEMTTETTMVAKMCHAANKAWCELHGDFSQPEWDAAPDWQKESAIQGVEFHRANPDAGDSASHDNWTALKVKEGWVYGKTKDPEAKTHPCIVPFDDLPHQQRKKDAIFRAIVHALGD